MSGIFGFLSFEQSTHNQNLISDMAYAFNPDPKQRAEIFTNELIQLGRINIGVTNTEVQPIWDQKKTTCILMSGEIFGYQDRKAELLSLGYKFGSSDDAQFILNLYLEVGDDFVKELNGSYAVVIWDERLRKLLITNDRLGMEPLYFTRNKSRFSFATGVRALLTDPEVSKTLDYSALANFLTFDHVLGNQTFLNDVTQLPPASTLTLEDGYLDLKTYWEPKFPESISYNSEAELLDQLIFLLRQAVSRQRPEFSPGILLSGGFDSRLILAILQEIPGEYPVKTFTIGVPKCDDYHYAKEIANYYGIDHYFDELKPDYLVHKAEIGSQITDGMENVVHMHMLANLSTQAEYAKIFYKGFLGDSLMGIFSDRDFIAKYAIDELIQLFFERYPILFNFTDHQNLFSDDLRSHLGDTLPEIIKAQLINISGNCRTAAEMFFQFDLQQRQRRLTVNGVRLVRSQAVVRTPFYDNDLLDFMLRIPQGYRLNRYLFKEAMIKCFPELMKIPTTETGLPLIECRRKLMIQQNLQIRWRLRSTGFNWIPIPQKRPYANYNQWFREDLKEWAEDLLLSHQSRQRGYFNHAYVKKVFNEHQAGKDHYKRLGALISIELWHRQFLD